MSTVKRKLRDYCTEEWNVEIFMEMHPIGGGILPPLTKKTVCVCVKVRVSEGKYTVWLVSASGTVAVGPQRMLET